MKNIIFLLILLTNSISAETKYFCWPYPTTKYVCIEVRNSNDVRTLKKFRPDGIGSNRNLEGRTSIVKTRTWYSE